MYLWIYELKSLRHGRNVWHLKGINRLVLFLHSIQRLHVEGRLPWCFTKWTGFPHQIDRTERQFSIELGEFSDIFHIWNLQQKG